MDIKVGKAEHKLWIKEQIKNYPTTMGVLSFRHKGSGKQFIQCSLQMEALINRIRYSLNAGTYTHAALQADWRRDGEEAFEISFLATLMEEEGSFVNYRQELKKLEKQLIDNFTADGTLY